MLNFLEKAAQDLISWLVLGIAGAGSWLIRQVFTNRKEIELLRAELATRGVERDERVRRLETKIDRLTEIVVHNLTKE
jgi:hypothetical protein